MSLMPGAQYHGPLPPTNYRAGAMAPIIGMVVHHADGSLAAADARFKTPGSQASAHFGVDFDGTIWQWLDTADVAYHACAANWHGYLGVENASDPATPNAPLTDAQVVSNRAIAIWAGVPLTPATATTSGGVGYHRQFPGSCGVDDWGATSCPGDGIIAQIPAICTTAPPTSLISQGGTSTMNPSLIVRPDGTIVLSVTGTNSAVYVRTCPPGGDPAQETSWTAWLDLGGAVRGDH